MVEFCPVDTALRERVQALLNEDKPSRGSKLRKKVEQILRNETKVRGRDGPTSGLSSTYVTGADVVPPPENSDEG